MKTYDNCIYIGKSEHCKFCMRECESEEYIVGDFILDQEQLDNNKNKLQLRMKHDYGYDICKHAGSVGFYYDENYERKYKIYCNLCKKWIEKFEK